MPTMTSMDIVFTMHPKVHYGARSKNEIGQSDKNVVVVVLPQEEYGCDDHGAGKAPEPCSASASIRLGLLC